MISHKSSGEVAILRPKLREETVDEVVDRLLSLCKELAASGNRQLAIDRSDTKGCADDAAGVLMAAWALYEKHGGKIVACGVSKNLRNAFHMFNLDTVIEMYDTEAEAIASFGGR